MQNFNSGATFDPVYIAPGEPPFASCNWHTRPGFNPGVLPSTVNFQCPSGLQKVPGYRCASPNAVVPECIQCLQAKLASQQPERGHPVSVATGAESEAETDYATADALLSVTRLYRSTQRGRPEHSDHEMPGFGYAWHGIIPARIIISGANEEVAEVFDASGTIDFFSAPSDTSVFTYAEQGVSRQTLSMVGTPTGSRVDYFQNGASVANGAGEMRLNFGNGEYILFRRSDVYRYEADIRYMVPIEHGYPNGYRQFFDYPDTGEFPSRIRDSFGRQIQITWQNPYDIAERFSYMVVSQLTLPDGTTTTYQYTPPHAGQFDADSPKDRLVSATHLNASGAVLWQHSYLYENAAFPYAMTGVVDQNQQRLSTFAYSTAGLATSVQLAAGVDQYTFEYLQDPPSQTLQNYIRNVTGPLGELETYSFVRNAAAPAGMVPTLMRIDRAASSTVPASSQVFKYTNTNGYDFTLASEQDFRGTTQAMTADGVYRRPIATIEAQGTAAERTTNTTWHPTFDLPTHEVRQGLATDSSYGAGGQLLTRTETDTTSQTAPYSTSGQTRTTTYSWNANGRLLSVNGPLAADAQGHDDIMTFAYDASGNRTSMTDGLGHATSYSNYDANGRPGTMTDMNGIVTNLTYDGLGRVATMTIKHPSNASLDAVTTINYDVEGRVVGITRPATEKLIFDYNLAGQMTSMRAANGERIDYTYDAMGDVVSETTRRIDGSVSKAIARTFDSLGRMLSEAVGSQPIMRWSYDANGNATTLTNPMNNPTTQAFDPLDRLVSMVAPDGGTTGLLYDQKDGLTQNVDPKSVTTTFVRNGFGDVIQESSPDRDTSINWYDAAGRITRSQDGRGQIVDYSRDILGRLTQKVPEGHASDAVTYTWDAGGLAGSYGVGHLGAMTDASGKTQFQYDHRGNMLAQQQTVGGSAAAQLVYAYDLGDRITQITYPSGRVVQYGRDTKGRVNLVQTKASASASSWTSLASGYSYEPFAAMKAMALGNSLAVANDWGGAERLTTRRLYNSSTGTNLSSLAYSYDADDNVTAITDALDDSRSIFYGYDVNDRLTKTLLTAATAQTGTVTYSYATGTNRLSSVADASGTRAIGYDARGNLASESRPGSINATTSYDGYARLVGYARTDVGTLSFVYNGRDDRVTTTSGTGTRHFVYDPDGRVLGEYGTSANDVKAEFIWASPQVANDNSLFGGDDGAGGYMPLAVATPDSSGTIVLDWVHGNHLGVPLITTNATGNLATTPNDYLAPGFPGQSRTVADLFYNRYRDYDPTTGRYIQADPIGLAGGQNNYAYAANNPINVTDPQGLQVALPFPVCFAGPWGAAACAAVPAVSCLLIPACRNAFVPPTTAGPDCPPSLMNEAKAPGQPGPEDGYKAPKGGPRIGKAPNGQRGWVDDKGNVWVPTGPAGSPNAHGGPHWDVQGARGGYTNVYPGGRTR